MLLGAEEDGVARQLGHAEALRAVPVPALHHPPQHRTGNGRRAVPEGANGREVGVVDLGVIEQHRDHRRREREHRDRVGADEVGERGGVERGLQHDRARPSVQDHHVVPGHVAEREGRGEHVVRADGSGGERRVDRGHEARVGEHRQLRVAGRARRADEPRGVVDLATRRHPLTCGDEPRRARVEVDRRDRGVESREQRRRAVDEADVGARECPLPLVGMQAVVERHEDPTGERRRVVQLDVLGAVLGEDCDAVAERGAGGELRTPPVHAGEERRRRRPSPSP